MINTLHNSRTLFFTISLKICLLCICSSSTFLHASITPVTNTSKEITQSVEYITQDDLFAKELTLSEKIRYFDLLLLQVASDFGYDINIFTLISTQKKHYKNSWYTYQEFRVQNKKARAFLQEIIELEQLYPKSFSIENIDNTRIEVFIDTIRTHIIYTPTLPRTPTKYRSPYMTIVIDDIGENVESLKKLLQLPFPITYALWPFSSKTQTSMNLLKRYKQEMIIHMPMEPNGYPKIHSGKGTLLTTMKGKTLQKHIKKAIDAVPYAIGINNHMGSKATQDTNFVISLIQYIKKEYPEYMVLDSVTHPRSVLYSTARRMNIPTAKRHVFLDHKRTVSHTVKQLEETERLSKKYGRAIAIGHPAPTTITALQKWSKTRNSSIKIISLREFVAQSSMSFGKK